MLLFHNLAWNRLQPPSCLFSGALLNPPCTPQDNEHDKQNVKNIECMFSFVALFKIKSLQPSSLTLCLHRVAYKHSHQGGRSYCTLLARKCPQYPPIGGVAYKIFMLFDFQDVCPIIANPTLLTCRPSGVVCLWPRSKVQAAVWSSILRMKVPSQQSRKNIH